MFFMFVPGVIQIGTRWCNATQLNSIPIVGSDEKMCIHACKKMKQCTHAVWDEQRFYCFLFDRCEKFVDDVVPLKTFSVKK